MPSNSSRQSTSSKGAASGRGAGAQGAATSASSSTAAGSPPADRERTVNVSREQEPRGEEQGQQITTPRGAGQGGTAYVSPFAFMRRFGEDMDRLLDDFGLGRPLDPFALLEPAMGYDYGRRPALGTPARPAGGSLERRPTAGAAASSGMFSSGTWVPQIEVTTRDDALVVRADLPGMKREDVSIEIDDGRLVLRGVRQQSNEERGDGFYHSERSYGSFARVVPLPKGVDADAVQARYADGVLEVTVPLPTRSSSAKRIEIR